MQAFANVTKYRVIALMAPLAGLQALPFIG
jgi:hypothetical protein